MILITVRTAARLNKFKGLTNISKRESFKVERKHMFIIKYIRYN